MVGFADPLQRRLVEAIRERVAEFKDEQRMLGVTTERDDHKAVADEVATTWLLQEAQRRVSDGHPQLTSAEEEALVQAAVDQAFGTPWESHLRPEFSDVMMNGPRNVFAIDRQGRKHRLDPVANSVDEFIEQIRWVGAHGGRTGRRFDASSPTLNMRLENGARLHAIYEVATAPSVTIRLHDPQLSRIDELAGNEMMDRALVSFLKAAVLAKQNIVLCGGMGVGKTTLCRALLNEVPADERLVTVEDELELGIDHFPDLHPDVVSLEARPANVAGAGGFGMEALLRECLRMNPDRIVVGETRGAEVLSMLLAMTAGKAGSMCTIHANSTKEAFERLAMYASMTSQQYSQAFTYRLVGSAVNFVVHIDNVAGARRVTSVREVTGATETHVVSNEVWEPDIEGKAVPSGEPFQSGTLRALTNHGFDRDLMDKVDGWWGQ